MEAKVSALEAAVAEFGRVLSAAQEEEVAGEMARVKWKLSEEMRKQSEQGGMHPFIVDGNVAIVLRRHRSFDDEMLTFTIKTCLDAIREGRSCGDIGCVLEEKYGRTWAIEIGDLDEKQYELVFWRKKKKRGLIFCLGDHVFRANSYTDVEIKYIERHRSAPEYGQWWNFDMGEPVDLGL